MEPEQKDNEPHMSSETYRYVMSWDNYPEPVTGERQMMVEMHRRLPQFSERSFKNGITCVYPRSDFHQQKREPGAGFAYTVDGKHCDDLCPAPSLPVRKEGWQTLSSKKAWAAQVRNSRKKERISVFNAAHPNPPHACRMCMDMDASKKGCKLPWQEMLSLCSRYNANRGVLVLPENKRASMTGPFMMRLLKHERRNRPSKIWVRSTLPTLNRNDGKFLRYDVDSNGQAVRVYSDFDPRLVPEKALSHDRTEDNSGYEECAYPDEWKEDVSDPEMQDDYVYMDSGDEIKRQCFEMPKPDWAVTRSYKRNVIAGTLPRYREMTYTEWVKVWKRNDAVPEAIWYMWVPNVPAFTFTLEERKVTKKVRCDEVILRTVEYPTIVNVRTEESFAKEVKAQAKATGASEQELSDAGTILVKSSTVITKKERKFFDAKRAVERQKKRLTGYLIASDVNEGKSIPRKRGSPLISLPARR